MKEIVGEKAAAEFAQIGGAAAKIRILAKTVQSDIRLLCHKAGPRHHGLQGRAHFVAHLLPVQDFDRDEQDPGNQNGRTHADDAFP
ncbi:MAG: hypothetical protein HPM95_18125 [Alphaproteobacteria bacterium]|nr:hypothetical protein [Alphaproteobacteria bacterium]